MTHSRRARARSNKAFVRSIRSNPHARKLIRFERVAGEPTDPVIDYPEPLPEEPQEPPAEPTSRRRGSLGSYLDAIQPEYMRRMKEIRKPHGQ